MNNRKCIYTVIIGDYDNLPDIKENSDWDHICFTDNKKLKSDTWNIIYIDNNKNNERDIIKLSRFYKICFFTFLSQYDILLYIDARISIKKKLDGMLETLDGFDIVFVKHYARNNINEEFKEVLQLGLESSKVINKIKHRYKEANYNYDNGLYVGRFFLFRNNENTVKFFMNWWNEVKNYSHRDQLSLNFVLKNNSKLKYNVIQYNEALKYFKLRKRKTERPKFK